MAWLEGSSLMSSPRRIAVYPLKKAHSGASSWRLSEYWTCNIVKHSKTDFWPVHRQARTQSREPGHVGLITKRQSERLGLYQCEILHLVLEITAALGLKVAQFMTIPKARQRRSKAEISGDSVFRDSDHLVWDRITIMVTNGSAWGTSKAASHHHGSSCDKRVSTRMAPHKHLRAGEPIMNVAIMKIAREELTYVHLFFILL